jgi:uncharacterized protein HemY
MILLALALQAADTPADTRYKTCLDLATSNPEAARNEAERFRLDGGGFKARQCLGLAYAQEERWRDAAIAFEAAAQEAAAAKDVLAYRYWAQAGNAWLATGEPVKAYAALNAALAAGTLTGQDEGEALLDRARSLVAAGQLPGARTDLDAALELVRKDPLAWLLSATLARRMKNMPRAQLDIGEALKLSADDASVQLEAGNIAAWSGDADAAKKAWETAVKLAPASPAGQNARAALGQFDAPAPTPAPPTK